jgi:hypothetical protein
MSESVETDCKTELQWQKDVWPFLVAFWSHWTWWVISILGSAIGHIIQARGVMIPSWILWLIAMSGVVIASFLTWRDQKHIADAKEAELKMATTKHAEEKRILEEKIKTLSDTKKEEERAEFIKKYTKIILANQLQNLETRIGEIGNLSGIAYKNSKKEGQDIATNELINRISSFLKERVSHDSAIIFTSKTGATYTPVPAWAYPQPDERERYTTIDNLNHFAAQLKEIIKNH